MMISSYTDQPRHWTTLSAVARYEPRCPSGARISTIDGTRASVPTAAAAPSMMQPATDATTIASSACFSDSPGTSSAPATITSRLTARFPQSSSVSPSPSTRSRSGTGSIPHCGASLLKRPPFAGTSRIRFDGCALSPAVPGTPVVRARV